MNQLSNSQIQSEKKYFINSIFKLLPYKQEGYKFLDKYFNSIIQQLTGFNYLIGNQTIIVTVLSVLEYAKHEDNFQKYRKAILDACSMIEQVKGDERHA